MNVLHSFNKTDDVFWVYKKTNFGKRSLVKACKGQGYKVSNSGLNRFGFVKGGV